MHRRSLTLAASMLVAAAFAPAALHAQAASAVTAPDTVIFTSKRGVVTFTHASHADLAECAVCHHDSRAEMPLESPQQGCRACHTEPATPPVTTSIGDAMHDTKAKEGVCLSCHMQEAAAGREDVPTKCGSCHVRDG